jgi:HEAT repeat protein
VRAKAVEALGEIGDEETIPALRKRLKDWDRDTKAAAVIALGKLKDSPSAPALKELLWDKDEIVREKATLALGMVGSREAIPALKELLQDPNGLVRIAAAESLHMMGDDSGKDFLFRAAKADDKDAKLRALAVLEKMATPKDVPALKSVAGDQDKMVAVTAARAIVIASENTDRQWIQRKRKMRRRP